ncbi:MAG: S8 family serine peptidase, partial [Gammaproteobacteria bacterium]
DALKIALLPNVRYVERNRAVTPDTDRGPIWIGAPETWDGSATGGVGTFGEGVIVGILDSGIAIGVALDPDDAVDFVGPLTHLSFVDPADVPSDSPLAFLFDGYDHQNPLGEGVYLGACDPGNVEQYLPQAAPYCNDKLIGYYEFLDAAGANNNDGADCSVESCDLYSPNEDRIWNVKDTDGHGTHVASTAAGNFLFDLPAVDADGNFIPGTILEQISGVAPHANVVSYKVCAFSCFFSDIAAATEQAIIDGVDVLNMSIGNAYDPWGSTTAQAFLSAHAAGVAVANSAGNDGPNSNTVNANSAPWVLGVASSTHDREILPKFLQNMSGGDTTPPADMSGLAITGGFIGDIVYAADYPTDNGSDNDTQPEQCLAPFPEGTFPADTIVLCDRGTIARVDKGKNVRDGGAAAFILGNIQGGATSVVADNHVIPAIHIDADHADLLRAWLASGSDHAGEITASEPAVSNPAVADILSGFSSRGPFTGFDLLAPHVSAPGDAIYAAGAGNLFEHQGQGNEAPSVNALFGQIGGTSMSSPHAAGSLTLLSALYPDWSTAALHSALMSTGVTEMRKEDGETPADPFDFGGGRVQPSVAANVGLVFEETPQNFADADPSADGDPASLNVPHLVRETCVITCGWERTVTAVRDGSWTVSSRNGVVTAEPSEFSLAVGESQTLTLTADVTGQEADVYVFDFVDMTPSDPETATQHMTAAVQPNRGNIPDNISIDAGRDADSRLLTGLTSVGFDSFNSVAFGLSKADQERQTLPQDPTNDDPFDSPEGVYWKYIDSPAEAKRLIVETFDSESPDLDLFVGVDVLDTGPDDCCILDSSATASADETVVVEQDVLQFIEANFPGKPYWVLVQNWAASAPDAEDAFTLAVTAVDDMDTGTLSVEGPAGPVEPLEEFDVRVFWSATMEPGDLFYGQLDYFGSPDLSEASFLGSSNIRAVRGEDDVSIAVAPELVQIGGMIDVTASVKANFTSEARTYSVSVPIPEGMSYVAGSADASGGSFDGSAVSFTVTQESLLGQTPEYRQATNDPARDDYDAACTMPFDLGSYINLDDFGVDPIVGGDDDTFAISGLQPMDFYGSDRSGSINVNMNGFMFFDSTPGPTDGFANDPIPTPTDPNDMIAPLWKDLITELDEGTGSGVSAAGFTCGGAPCLNVIEFDDATDWETETASYDFEAVISASENFIGPYEIIFGYANIDHGACPECANTVTTGVESPTGETGNEYAFNTLTDSIFDGLNVCYDLAGIPDDPTPLSFQVYATGGAGSTVEFIVSSDVDTPGTMEESSSAFVEVSKYVFGGFEPPVVEGSVHQINRTVPIQFRLRDGETGQPATEAVGLRITNSAGDTVLEDSFEKIGGEKYRYQLNTRGLTPDDYTITAILPDGIERSVTVTLRKGGNGNQG